MNEAMKYENIVDYAKKMEIEIGTGTDIIYAQTDAKLWEYAVFSAFAVLSIRHYLLCFQQDRIIVIGLTAVGDFTDRTTVILRKDIHSVNYIKGFMQGTLKLEASGNRLEFKVPKFIAVAPWQKVNLEKLIEKGFI